MEKEKAKAAKFKGWLEKMTEQKSALETELSEVLCVSFVCVCGYCVRHLCVCGGGAGGQVRVWCVCLCVWLSKILGGNMIPVSQLQDEFSLCYGML